jgi:hypothetical protein
VHLLLQLLLLLLGWLQICCSSALRSRLLLVMAWAVA